MGSVETSSLLWKAGLRQEMVMLSASGHHQHQLLYQKSLLSASSREEEDACAPADRSSLLLENFSVDELLDLSSSKDQNYSKEEGFLGFRDPEEEEEEEEGEEEEGAREDSPNNNNTLSSSPLSFQALPPSSDLIVPAGDAAELEWVSRFVDDSYSEFPSSSVNPAVYQQNAPAPALPAAKAAMGAPKAQFTTLRSPLKRNWGSCGFSSQAVPSKARSKRSRTVGRAWFLFRPLLLAESSAASCSTSPSSFSASSSPISSILLCGNFGDGNPHRLLKLQQQPLRQLHVKKKKGRKPKAFAATPTSADGTGSNGGEQQPRRRCTHCGVDRTPQWRAGPMGAKTLCNACGVRFKSGRLLPEYRPAGSPTFLSHLHSNSHRKVLEMRRSKELAVSASCSVPPPPSPPPQPASTLQPYGVV